MKKTNIIVCVVLIICVLTIVGILVSERKSRDNLQNSNQSSDDVTTNVTSFAGVDTSLDPNRTNEEETEPISDSEKNETIPESSPQTGDSAKIGEWDDTEEVESTQPVENDDPAAGDDDETAKEPTQPVDNDPNDTSAETGSSESAETNGNIGTWDDE